MALNMLLKHVSTKLELKQKIVIIFLDFSKAFDSVDHKWLINKLNRMFNISINGCKLLLSYLTEQKQFVNLGSSKSKFGV